MFDLTGNTAIVTGAANGIGRAITQLFADRGAKVVAADLESDDLERYFSDNDNVVTLTADVTAADTPQRLCQSAVDNFGGLDILVNNAGICIAAPFEDLTVEQWDTIMAVNTRSIFTISQAAIPYLKQSKHPRIINLGSIMSDMAGPALSIYAASKHLVAGLTKGMAVDLGEYGITVNYLQPGSIVTRMSEPFMDDPEFKKYWQDKAPVGRLGEAEEVANAALFLASEESRFISGVGLNVDGGAIVKF